MILHLANDYAGSIVYKNLVTALDFLNIDQIIYVPIRNQSLADKNRIKFNSTQSNFFYKHILSPYTRINYKAKTSRILKDLNKTIDFSKIEIIHSHTWFSDGAIAYELFKRHKTPYIVTVRNTDLNLFYKYVFFLRKYGIEILENASKIIFISPVYKKRFFDLKRIVCRTDEFFHKSTVIPNGIDVYWIENSEKRKERINKTPQLLFIGRFTKGKNIMNLIYAVKKLEEEGFPCILNLIGGGGKAESKVLKYIEDKPNIRYHGQVLDKNKLKEFYLMSDIYTMPSIAETFGLVYIEALSQGIPVVYTRNEGIDGLYGSNIGEAVNCQDIGNIAEGIKKIILNYQRYDFNNETILLNHNWTEIAKTYQNIYREITV